MVVPIDDQLTRIAGQVADCFSASGYAFVEEENLETLAAALRRFLTEARIPVNAGSASYGASDPPPLSGTA
jgi:hypothetical protein